MQIKKVLTTREVAKIMGIRTARVLGLIKEGIIPAFKTGRGGYWRIPQEPFEEWLWFRATEKLDPRVKAGIEAMRPIRARLEQIRQEEIEKEVMRHRPKVFNNETCQWEIEEKEENGGV